MKTFGILLTVFSLIVFINQIRLGIVSNYAYEKTYGQLWQLADKSSTIPAKQEYITQFVTAIKVGQTNGVFAEYNALFLKTPNNQFAANLKALETLSQRLTEIQNMDPTSFQYNTAIEQITKQEQGEAGKLISVFQGCYNINNYFLVWNWVGALVTMSSTLLFCAGLFITFWKELSLLELV